MIVRSALPLLAEHGAAVTTRQIAQAAGIAEGTVFRAFTDKDELLVACVAEVFRTDELCARIQQVAEEPDMTSRLIEAGVLFVEHYDRLGDLMQALATSGFDVHKIKRDGHGPAEFMRYLGEAFASLLDAHQLRMPPETVARMLLGLLVSSRFGSDERHDRRDAVARRVDVLLNGALLTEPHCTKLSTTT